MKKVPDVYRMKLILTNYLKKRTSNAKPCESKIDNIDYNIRYRWNNYSSLLAASDCIYNLSEKNFANFDQLHLLFKDRSDIFSSKLKNTKYSLKDSFVVVTQKYFDHEKRNLELELLCCEMIISIFGINNLRKKIPNFVYLFGYGYCGYPFDRSSYVPITLESNLPKNNKSEIKNIKLISSPQWCKNNVENTFYAVYENIRGISLEKSIQSMNVIQIANIFFQILCSLRLARIELKFTHYDLHDQNILIKKSKEKIHILYDTKHGTRRILTDEIAMIIDFDLSRMEIDEFPDYFFGRHLPKNNIFDYAPNILTDVYRLIIALDNSKANLRNNRPVFLFVERIFDFFAGQFGRLRDYGKQPTALNPLNLKLMSNDLEELDLLIDHFLKICEEHKINLFV